MKSFSIIFLILVLSACSTRDFLSNPVLIDQYTPPTIDIYSPVQSFGYNGWIDVQVHAYCPTGVDRIIIQSENQSITFYNAYRSADFNIQTNLYYLTSSWKHLSVTAYGVNKLETSKGVDYYIQVPTPSVWINQPSNYETLTNQASILFNGTASISEGFVTNIFTVTSGDMTNIQLTNIANGTNNWSVTVSLFKNMRNRVMVYGVSDKGVISWPQEKQVTVDLERPVCTLLYPLNGADVPSTISGIIEAYDRLSWINDWSVYYRIDGAGYSSASKLGGNWGFTSAGNSAGGHTISVYALDGIGNSSITQTVNVSVSPDMPMININNWLKWAVNDSKALVYGTASVEVGHTITKVLIRVNNGPWTAVNHVSYGMSIGWSNTNTLINLNATNTVVAMAISGTPKTNYTLVHYVISDNIPPKINYISLTNNQVVVNAQWPYQDLNVSDELSGLGMVSNIMKSASMGTWENNNSAMFQRDLWCGLSYNIPGGGAVTNIIIVRDMAGNKLIKTNIFKVYPDIYVSAIGNDSTGKGYQNQPFATVQKGLDFAFDNGVYQVKVAQGTYTLTAPIQLKNGVRVQGGFSVDFINQNPFSYPTVLDGGGFIKHIMMGSGISYSQFDGVQLKNAVGFGLGEKGGGIYLVNSYMEIYNSIIQNNTSDMGGAVYCQNSTFKIYNSKIDQNKAKKGSAFYFEIGSWAEIRDSIIVNNNCDTPVGADMGNTVYAKDSRIFMEFCSNYNNIVNGAGVVSYTFNQLYIDGGQSAEIKNSYIQGNHTFSIGITNRLMGIYFNNSPGYVLIDNNNFILTRPVAVNKKTFGIWESMPLSGHTLMNNKFSTNSLDVLYRDTMYGNLTTIMQLNDGFSTGAASAWGNWVY
jgi:hypothetical protein